MASSTDDPINWPSVDWIVMFGWRNIIKEPWLTKYRRRMINIHASFLPWNRGAYPNLFSWIENTKKGVSIHYVSPDIDMGNIIVRQEVDFSQAPHTTLQSAYDALRIEAGRLFERSWPIIRRGDVIGMAQTPALGSFHTVAQARPIIDKLPKGWETPVNDLQP